VKLPTGLGSDDGLTHHWSHTQLQLSHVHTVPHTTTAYTWHCQDGRPQYRVITSGLRQCTTTQHIGKQPQQDASGQSGVSSPKFCQCYQVTSELHWLPVHQRITYKMAVITYSSLPISCHPWLPTSMHIMIIWQTVTFS